MIVIWQGYGYVALAAAIIPLAACAGLFDFGTKLGFLGFGIGMLVASGICFGADRALRRGAARREAETAELIDPDNPHLVGGAVESETVHTLYFVPLWVWGWIYGLFGLLFGGVSLVGIILKGWKD